ncbi:MAG: DNA metabolism protein [Lachnospiraceae bacterium]|jgi:probable DNA metabolism protein|nr:DNA metabolism protein [Lachnospiraceae bacterium]
MDVMVFVCEDSIEGILTGVYDAWAEALSSRLGHAHCRLAVTGRRISGVDGSRQDGGMGDGQGSFEEYFNLELFCTYRDTPPDAGKAGKVIRTLRRRLGEEVYECLCYAMASREPDKAEAVYKTIVAGLSMKEGHRTLDKVTDPYVARCFDLKRNVGSEIHRELEFLRFQELESGVLLAKIHPKNDVLMYLGPHFSDRLPLENFLIYDISRRKALFHEREKDWYMMDALELDGEMAGRISTEEEYYQDLFRTFCRTIAIESRENRALQRQFLPLYFRDLMPEFQ